MLLSLVPRVQSSPTLTYSFWTAAAALTAWQGLLYWRLRRDRAGRTVVVALKPQHYLQALVQLAVFGYWGWYWRPVYDHAWLVVAQLVFAYGFDMLLTWSRREQYVLGLGPFPIVFSTNLFLWFRDDWFYLQFLLLAVGLMGKELIRWNRDGRLTHIFNPSAFSLGLFSLALILTGTTHLTWGEEIASTLTLAPRIYLFLFGAGLVVMYAFSITLIAGCAAAVLFGLSAVYSAATGVPYFLDAEIPAAVFLGLHLLVTDPSTSPRTPVGKAAFGALYGLGVFLLYSLLGTLGVPSFYDKLLCVPLLNLGVRALDRLASHAAAPSLPVPTRFAADSNLAHIGVWILLFGTMTALGSTDGHHPGDSLPFWQQACEDRRRDACDRLIQLQSSYCADNSGWACNELGVHFAAGPLVDSDPQLALAYFSRGCELRFTAACFNLLEPGGVRRANPRPLDLRLLLREGGRNLMEWSEADLYARACAHQWRFACAGPTP